MIESLLLTIDPELFTSFVILLIVIVFFLSTYLIRQNKAHEFVQYTPTLLTTVGIFGTFVGIVIGLMEFDHTQIDQSISALLAGLKTAFITSLVGMLSSIVFKSLLTTPVLKPKQGIEQVSVASPEAILGAIQTQVKETVALKEALVGNEESTLFGQLKIMRGDVNDNAKLHKQLLEEQNEKLVKNFNEFSEKLWLKLQDFADTLSKSATEEIIEALKQVIADFNNNLTEQFGDNFKQLNEAVIKLVEWQENYKQQLEQMNAQYEHGVQSIASTEASISKISQEAQVIPETMNNLKNVLEVNQHQISELDNHLEAFKDMRDRAVEAVPEIRAQVERTVADISGAVNDASKHYERLLTESDEFINKHISTSEELLTKFKSETESNIEAIGTKLIESSEKMGKEIDLAGTEFTNNTARTNESLQTSSDYLAEQSAKIKATLDDTITDLNNAFRDMIAKLVDDAKVLNTTFKEANTDLISDTQKVRDSFVNSTESLQQQLQSMLEESAKQQISQAQRTFDSMEQSVKQQIGLTDEAVKEQLGLIDQSMQAEIQRVMNEMGRSLGKIAGKFTQDYQQLTNAMHKIVREKAEF
ncbi:MotA/TolQ/ExbB proton channel family protein [Thalassotalea ponticola]|uniref:MotA/TolQ/ExbB proton channel family protein n=1 Tax=Thalassotalea ponticola TaxID=1523392 RepID=UPI0025B4E537|nr:MotA/TolQ/ExbB proton channel family protein [Thalassotalea ponticola]MDN3652309.1 MotA/TolQ/ExbB proton channel family protein [Thalassotalea ponticola]